MIPAMLAVRARPLSALDATDPVVCRYRAIFAELDWRRVPERDPQRAWPGRCPQPRSAYLKALLVKVCERQPYVTELRAYLVEHPALVLELGFRPVLDATQPAGFDVERTVPGVRWLRHQQQTLDQEVLRALLAGTVVAVASAVPDFGATVAIDVKHSYAWVKENNPKVETSQRGDPARQPRGDPDCRLGVKRQRNQDLGGRKTYLWGCGVASAIHPLLGDVVLAEWTQPFNQQDITWAAPLLTQTGAHLGFHPPNLAADAAFDAWHVYQRCADLGGMAAVPLNQRGPRPVRDAAGHPSCAQGWSMTPTSQFQHEDGYRAQRYACPLLRPTPSGVTCPDARFARGGCRKVVNLELGGLLRLSLDRQSAAYRRLYNQRTSAERINSQATALGIERPKVRRLASVARLNTLTYVVINIRVLQRLRRRQHAPPGPVLC
jgi:Transposase DDE domain